MKERIDKIIRSHWQEMVNENYFYRGMSLNNLNLKSSIVLDPSQNPFKNIKNVLLEYNQLLCQLVEKGLECNINDFYVEPLQKILGWTIRDLQNPGIDFTTNYADAVSYAFNYAGSQIKHNFNLIVNTIHEYKNHSCFTHIDHQKFWHITEKIKSLLEHDKYIMHQPVVIKVRRSCAAFETEIINELNLGSYDFFYDKVKKEAIKNNMFMIDKIAFFLHQKSQSAHFNIRLIKPLHKDALVDIIKL
ncbi:TPA: hypothetical protein DIC20_05430 [Candidatus Dependentiae bacterium]|nr:MAG: hypothetical protein US03_C0005G0029 [candidate division TM6 bacterium GW2011_GWF2_36_131]KKQ03132.1 MAG: hypothetical protein US13_C0005G0016 [candidate division TM6 bacterium GW2011_GWE2_36_25]KKQ19380.1 MAG: hypothetical protein US32_C0010G0029 [candidate division TM6 bacterium GW2011_GWA2_36_9]HBR71033.1 hypothetical protein [Candidatus Dependentiae bacterium]HCU01107.1 hypothetical protein [Candidatus Dependentiae bacterium]